MTEEQKKDIVTMYKSGIGAKQIATEKKMGILKVREFLKEEGILRTKSEAMRLNRGGGLAQSDVFDVLTPDALYWIGFLYADGHIDRDRPRISVVVSEKDIQHLHKLKAFIGDANIVEVTAKNAKPAPGQINEGGRYFRVAFSDKKIHSRLIELGFSHNKTLNLVPNNLLKYSRDFWRGAVDGDGWVCNGKTSIVGLSGTIDTINCFIDFVISNGIETKATPLKNKRANVHQVDLHTNVAKKTAALLYKDSTVYLDRKYEKYLSFLKIQ